MKWGVPPCPFIQWTFTQVNIPLIHTPHLNFMFASCFFACILHPKSLCLLYSPSLVHFIQSHQIIHFFTNSYVDHLETFLYRLFISQNPAITSLTLWLIGTITYLIHFNYSNRTLLEEYKERPYSILWLMTIDGPIYHTHI